jgi:hypothetical protein
MFTHASDTPGSTAVRVRAALSAIAAAARLKRIGRDNAEGDEKDGKDGEDVHGGGGCEGRRGVFPMDYFTSLLTLLIGFGSPQACLTKGISASPSARLNCSCRASRISSARTPKIFDASTATRSAV